jgi:hypothetical protein
MKLPDAEVMILLIGGKFWKFLKFNKKCINARLIY